LLSKQLFTVFYLNLHCVSGHQPSPLPHPTLLNRHSGVGVRPNAAALAAAAAAAAQTQARIRMYALFELDVIGTAPNLSLISIAARRAEVCYITSLVVLFMCIRV
jgi:hypothetical protein